MANTGQRKLAAIMFTDMVGYSALAQRDEALALQLLEEHCRLVRAILPEHQGQEIKTTGDGFLLEFPSALAAVQCAVEIQRMLARRNESQAADRQVQIRIGIHLGDVEWRDGDVFGDGVNIAARIEPLAEPGGICLTRAVYEQIENKVAHPLVQISAPALKNIQVTVQVYKLVLDGRVRSPQPSAAKRQLLATALLLIVAAIAGSLVFVKARSRRGSAVATSQTAAPALTAATQAADQHSVAVLPFLNMSSDKENEFLSDGITEDILNALAKVSGLRVPARTSAFVFKGRNEDVRKIGEMLHVATVLEGSVQRSGNRLRVTAQLINVSDGFHLWSEQFDREMKDVFSIQDEITRTIVAKLKVTLAAAAEPAVKHGTENIEAYQLYLKGRFLLQHYTEANIRQAVTNFQQAAQVQPDYALAYSGLQFAYGLLMHFGYDSPRAIYPLEKAAREKALRLDDTLVGPHVAEGYAHFYGMWNWPRAEAEFKRAIELDAANADAHFAYSVFLSAMDRAQEALVENNIAQQIDPLSTNLKLHEGWIFIHAHSYERALKIARQMLASEPNYHAVHQLMAYALLGKGRRDEAIAEMEAAVRLGTGPQELGELGRMYAQAGRQADARRVLQQLRDLQKQNKYIPARCLVDVFEGLGDFAQANAWMEKAIEEHDPTLVYLKVGADDLTRANPHFPEWLKKIGLER